MRRHPRRARVDPNWPEAWATDDRTGFVGNLVDLQWQMEWAGNRLINTRILTYDPDKPQRQLGTVFLPPDPPGKLNARPEQYAIDEVPVTTRVTMNGNIRAIMGGPPYRQRIISGDTFG